MSDQPLMSCFIVNFEVAQESTLTSLREKLRAYKIFCPMTATCWAIVSEKKAAEIRDDLAAVLNSGDRIFVIRSGTEGAWKNAYGTENSNWLKKHL